MLDSDGNYVVESHILEEHIQQQSQCDKQANQWHAETQKTKGTWRKSQRQIVEGMCSRFT